MPEEELEDVMSTFVRSLPDADLKTNMSVLIVTTLPSILPQRALLDRSIEQSSRPEGLRTPECVYSTGAAPDRPGRYVRTSPCEAMCGK